MKRLKIALALIAICIMGIFMVPLIAFVKEKHIKKVEKLAKWTGFEWLLEYVSTNSNDPDW